MCERASLDEVARKAWRAYDKAERLPTRVTPAVPILFFGDLGAYEAAQLRVLTAGLNPSRHEFPSGRPFARFPLLEGEMRRHHDRYISALSSYFRTDPYRAWFSAFEPLLNGAAASYYGGYCSTALHTDICSPVATDPTWSRLGAIDRSTLETDGGPLWHNLLTSLKPHVVVLSVAKRHLERIVFEPMDKEWRIIHAFHRTGTGTPRSRPYEVRARWYNVWSEPSLFVFGAAAQTPFGLISDSQKREAGSMILEAYGNGR